MNAASAVHLTEHDIEGAQHGRNVGKLVSPTEEIHRLEMRITRSADLAAVRLVAAIADDILSLVLLTVLDGAKAGNVDVIVHFAGVLFKANPEKFLPTTNTQYFNNLLNVAVEKKIQRVILISFPHVEGETMPNDPATGVLNGKPESMHAHTRLEEEKLLFQYGEKYGFEAVSLRVGMVYGKGVLMIDVGQWFARYWLLGVWKKPTYIHLISKTDFVDATIAAALKPDVKGIYHIGTTNISTCRAICSINPINNIIIITIFNYIISMKITMAKRIFFWKFI